MTEPMTAAELDAIEAGFGHWCGPENRVNATRLIAEVRRLTGIEAGAAFMREVLMEMDDSDTARLYPGDLAMVRNALSRTAGAAMLAEMARQKGIETAAIECRKVANETGEYNLWCFASIAEKGLSDEEQEAIVNRMADAEDALDAALGSGGGSE
jgi:hypothetical protein